MIDPTRSFIERYLETGSAFKAGSLIRCDGNSSPLGFYVYMFVAPSGEILHIGKGSKRRWLSSMRDGNAVKKRKLAGGNFAPFYFAVHVPQTSVYKIENALNKAIFGATNTCSHNHAYYAELHA